MEFLAQTGYWMIVGPLLCLAAVAGFVCVSQGTIRRNLLVQSVLPMACIALLVIVFFRHGWLAGLVTLVPTWLLSVLFAQLQMRWYESSSGFGHPDRPLDQKAGVFLEAYHHAKVELSYSDRDAHLYAQAKAGGYFPKPPETPTMSSEQR